MANIDGVLHFKPKRDSKLGHRVSFKADTDTIPSQNSREERERELDKSDNVTLDVREKDMHESHQSPEPDPWQSPVLLTLDGGGIRGYSTLLILEKLMAAIAKVEQQTVPPATSSASPYLLDTDEANAGGVSKALPAMQHSTSLRQRQPPRARSLRRVKSEPSSKWRNDSSQYLPCHYFDYICGTSTGGLIAVMLGRLRMSVSDCIDQYISMGSRVFGKPGFISIPPSLSHHYSKRNNTKRLKKLLKDMVERRKSKVSTDNFASSPGLCQTLVVAIRQSNTTSVPCLIRSYDPPLSLIGGHSDLLADSGLDNQIPIWKAARATTAAPTYFKPMKINGEKYIDGGMRINNPSWLLLNEIGQIQGAEIKILLSIGSGHPPGQPLSKSSKLLEKISQGSPAKCALQSDRTHNAILRSGLVNGSTWYGRFDVSTENTDDLWKLEQTLWRRESTTLECIESATKKYLNLPSVEDSLLQTARKLVECRRKRAETSKWESFAFGVSYVCSDDGCTTKPLVFKNRDDLISHMQRNHRLNSPGPDNAETIESILNKCRKMN